MRAHRTMTAAQFCGGARFCFRTGDGWMSFFFGDPRGRPVLWLQSTLGIVCADALG